MAELQDRIVPMKIVVRAASPAYDSYCYGRRRAIPLGSRAVKQRKEWHRALVRGAPGARGPAAAALAAGLSPTPGHDLVYHGGKLLPDLTYMNVFLGGSSAWNASDRRNINGGLAAAMKDRGLNNVLVQYFRGGAVTTTVAKPLVLKGTLPDPIGPAFLKNAVRSLFEQGRVPVTEPASTIVNFLLPPGAILRLPESGDEARRDDDDDDDDDDNDNGRGGRGGRRLIGGEGAAEPDRPRIGGEGAGPDRKADSLNGLGGFHGSVHIPSGTGASTTVYYSTGVFSDDLPNGGQNGIVVFDEPWKNVVATFYHELCEARTDPDVDDVIATQNVSLWGWADGDGNEIGDFPIFEAGNDLSLVFQEVPLANGSGSVPIQLEYSNFVHGPEGPAPTARPFSKLAAPGVSAASGPPAARRSAPRKARATARSRR